MYNKDNNSKQLWDNCFYIFLIFKIARNNDIQGSFFMRQTWWLNCTIGCWLLRWFEPLKFQLSLTPLPVWPRPSVCHCMIQADWELCPNVHCCPVFGPAGIPLCTIVLGCHRGVRARHNCSHCISPALCVIINCPDNNWRFVILARISHSSSLQLSERRCNYLSVVSDEWKEKCITFL